MDSSFVRQRPFFAPDTGRLSRFRRLAKRHGVGWLSVLAAMGIVGSIVLIGAQDGFDQVVRTGVLSITGVVSGLSLVPMIDRQRRRGMSRAVANEVTTEMAQHLPMKGIGHGARAVRDAVLLHAATATHRGAPLRRGDSIERAADELLRAEEVLIPLETAYLEGCWLLDRHSVANRTALLEAMVRTGATIVAIDNEPAVAQLHLDRALHSLRRSLSADADTVRTAVQRLGDALVVARSDLSDASFAALRAEVSATTEAVYLLSIFAGDFSRLLQHIEWDRLVNWGSRRMLST